ncbi:MAG: nitroreductase family deazaflavin-dependent oxidoreductase [Candidatus Promineofilum sp.]|nr:nitroreductase family deazaflavin-dependent oxidoreductase [Promineifilum sp.]
MSTWTDSPNIAQQAVRRLFATRPVAWLSARTVHHIDAAVLRLSGGRATASAILSGLPLLELTTTGAKSGRPRTVPLVGIPDGERIILIASNWGQARHPAWYHNLKANPSVTVTIGGVAHPYTARELAGEERATAFARAASLYPGYSGYAQRAGREIPVVRLER